ncbi:MAG TPA: RMD1 family protein [Candidatus Magasanikbacteria bacterium]|nr:RMD1 family protein [Candidatus Magasanikbacteria bacterium]
MFYQLVGKNLAKEVDFLGLAKKSPYELIENKRQFASFKIKESSFLFVFKFGVVVFVNIEEALEKDIIKVINPFLISKIKKIHSDSFWALEAEQEEYAVVGVKKPSINYKELSLIARVLAQSIEIDYFDQLANNTLNSLKQSQKNLQKQFLWKKEKEYVQNVSIANAMTSSVVVELSVLDKPSLLWEEPKLQLFFSQVADVFEIDDRFQALQYKTDLIRSSSQFILDILQAKKSNFLEWVVIILILFEVLIFIFDIWFKM